MDNRTRYEILESKEVPHWDWLRMKATTPSVYNAIIEAMEDYKKAQCLRLIEFMYSRAAQTSTQMNGHPAKWIIDINTLVSNDELNKLFEKDE